MILAWANPFKYAITVTLKIISDTTKVILATNKLVLVTAEYSDLIPNLLPGPFLSRCDAMAGCIGDGIIIHNYVDCHQLRKPSRNI